VCADLRQEFGEMSGGRLLITGGGGFSGVLPGAGRAALEHARGAPAAKIDVTVYDNYVRGAPEWLEGSCAHALI
jgi:UDP-glucuronate decarboxylase